MISRRAADNLGFLQLALDRDNRIAVHWRHDASLPMFRQMEKHLRELNHQSGGKYIRSLLWSWPLRKLLTAHPLGGCVLAANDRDGVVNEFGEVWNYPGLYVADGAIIPTALATNPSATIGALAERVVQVMIHGRELEVATAFAVESV